jgi:hypothetical protein
MQGGALSSAANAALICAADKGSVECVRLLLERGANMEAKDNVRSGSRVSSCSWVALVFATAFIFSPVAKK